MPAPDLGAFSISLAVQDLARSRAFYEALGFEVTGGSADEDYLVLVNGHAVVGLFQGMFEKNMLTFNPGLVPPAAGGGTLDAFDDVRAIQQVLRERGLEMEESADPSSTGPAHVVLVDPDGNPVLVDQFIDAP